MTIRYLADQNPDGTIIGTTSSDKLGFFGLATPIARPTITWVTTATATTALNETKINRLYAALENLGLIATA
jgi:hypothetical protein